MMAELQAIVCLSPALLYLACLTVLQVNLGHVHAMAGKSDRCTKGSPGKAANSAPGTDPARSTKTKAVTQATSGTLRHMLISADWAQSAVGVVLTLVIACALSGSIPGETQLTMLAIAVGLIVSTHWLRKLETRHSYNPMQGFLLMAGLVALPMALVGLAVAGWNAASPALTLPMVVAVLIAISSLAMVTLQGRLPSMIVAHVSVWTGFLALSAAAEALQIGALVLAAGFMLTQVHRRKSEARQRHEAERRQVQSRADELLSEYEESGKGWFWETDRQGRVTYVSPRIAMLLGGKPLAINGRAFTSMFLLDADAKESERTLNFHLSTRSSFNDLEVRAATNEEEERWWSISGRPVMDNFNNFMGFRGSGSDLTEAKLSQRHVTQLARFDSLTKLANRFQMSEWLEKILSSPRVERRACSMFLLDLDRFKQVNDTMGHPVGDALLKQVAERLRLTVKKAGSVGRLGGDEFQIILPGDHPREDLSHLAERVIEHLSQPYSIEGQRVIIGASIGVVQCPQHGTTSEELIRNADLALYAAKDGGRGRHHFYAQDLHSDAEERHQLEQDLRDAITHGGLELYYQPQVATMTEKIAGFEALLRWNHPVQGFISPEKFVSIAEDTGLIAPIGEWALRTACTAMAKWPDSVRVAVNVSPIQFADPGFPAIVTSAIANAGIDPARLELELTESVFVNDSSSTDAMFKALKGLGVRLALDDFGTGYSSLGYLKRAPFDKIKIDQSFVRGATVTGSRNGALIASIVSLAEALGMETTAEGVETLDELDLIRALGCSHIQGYIYEKPISQTEVFHRLETGLKAIAKGPKSARPARQKMLRKVVLQAGGHSYNGTIRNISPTGALVEGLWNVPPGTQLELQLSKGHSIQVMARWSNQDRMGVEFAQPLALDQNGAVSFAPPRSTAAGKPLLRKAG